MSSDDEDINIDSHKKLLSEINNIVKFQHIKKPKRSEPTTKISEFHLIKSKDSSYDDAEEIKYTNKKNVSIKSVASIVKKNDSQKKAIVQFQRAFKKDKVLKKPLEKIQADRIQRAVAYDKVKDKLSRWDAIVTKNKNAEQLVFPLEQDKTSFVIERNQPAFNEIRFKTQMIKEMEEITNECFKQSLEKEVEFPSNELLTLEEMKERRKELTRLKMKQAHRIAKKRIQGKIKSKKYHRLRKREEIKLKLKEFEELKITNPEAALNELAKIEKQRVMERASLRHKNTGTWAKNIKVRAQYDATAKQELEAQLALGRELTQKNDIDSSSDSEEEQMPLENTIDNPWIEGSKQNEKLDEIFSGYKKFWDEKNKAEKKLIAKDTSGNEKFPLAMSSTWIEEEISSKNSKDSAESYESNDENVDDFINKLFDKAEEHINNKVEEKLKILKPEYLKAIDKRAKNKKVKNPKKDAKYLALVRDKKLADIDEALNEGNKSDEEKIEGSPSKRFLAEIEKIKKENKSFMRGTSDEINPQSFLDIKSKHLITALSQAQGYDDADEDIMQDRVKANKINLIEAFKNDDIINDFIEEAEEKDVKREVSNNLPGWGYWDGHNMKKKNKIEEKAQLHKRKDRIIISSTPNEKLRKHLISSVPFPFSTVKDFEAAMRLPIGKDFIPKSAHSRLTIPSVVTKAGVPILPMTEDILVQSDNGNGMKRKKIFKRKIFKN